MPQNLGDVFRRLSILLLRGPRAVENRGLYERSNLLLSAFDYSNESSPVVGVALGPNDKDALAITVFLRVNVDGFVRFLSESLRLQEFPLLQLTTGTINPSSRPAVGGESIGEGAKKGQSGTFGCLVEDAVGARFLLSCNHVLCKLNSGARGSDPVWQPSSKDGGTASDRIGVLHDFAPITLGGVIVNHIDAALALPDDASQVIDGLVRIGTIQGTAPSIPYRMPVSKVGSNTKYTEGHFLYRTDFIQSYPGFGDALFERQVGIVGTHGDFSKDGDSGALVVNSKKEAVGLVFADAAEINMSFANPVYQVFDYFGVSPV